MIHAILVGVAVLTASTSAVADVSAQLATAQRTYDVQTALAAQAAARSLPDEANSKEATLLRIKTALLVAELYRIDWEKLPDSNLVARRSTGGQIDEAAEEALKLTDELPENSEKYRLKADVLGTMIRSDFRAKKYKKSMDEAAAKAVELDPNNALAYVTKAKPFVFAPEYEGGDPAKAIDLFSQALKIDPKLETARCLRGLAYEKAKKFDLAKEDYQAALAQNPECRPAKEQLEKLKNRPAHAAK